jgi:membrane protease YdiL (CAAX protease family)
MLTSGSHHPRRAVWLVVAALAWLASVVVLARAAPGAYVLPAISMAVLGVALPALVVGLTAARDGRPAPDARDARDARRARRQLAMVLGYLVVFAVVVLGWGFGALGRALTSPRAHELAMLAVKLVTMVVVPLALVAPGWRGLGAYARLPDRRTAAMTALVAVICVGVTAVALPSLAQLAALQPTASTLMWAVPACLGFVALAAGLTEEVLFRVVLQTRLAAVLGSQAGAIAVAALVFALAHVPGLYLRGDAAVVGVDRPTLGWTIAYAIAVLAPPGVFFGVLWARTRSLVVVVAVHAAIDLLPNLPGFLRTWGP